MSLSISPLFSSSSGNCTYVGTERTGLIVDAGLAGNKVEGALQNIGKRPGELSAILITHEHTDHIRGVGVLSRKYDLPVYAKTPGSSTGPSFTLAISAWRRFPSTTMPPIPPALPFSARGERWA